MAGVQRRCNACKLAQTAPRERRQWQVWQGAEQAPVRCKIGHVWWQELLHSGNICMRLWTVGVDGTWAKCSGDMVHQARSIHRATRFQKVWCNGAGMGAE